MCLPLLTRLSTRARWAHKTTSSRLYLNDMHNFRTWEHKASMSAAGSHSCKLRCMSKKRHCAYILLSAFAVTCYHIVSTLAWKLISASSDLPLLVGYTAHAYLPCRLQRQRSFQYCVLLSAALLSLGDAAHFIQIYIVADSDTMTSAHLAVTHFCLAFLVLSDTEYHSQTELSMPYPDVLLPRPANLIQQLRLHDSREPAGAVFLRAVAKDVGIHVLWHVGIWRFTSLLQAWLNPTFQPEAGVVFRPFTTAYGFEVVWTSRGVAGCALHSVMMRPVRILISYVFVCGVDGVTLLGQLKQLTRFAG